MDELEEIKQKKMEEIKRSVSQSIPDKPIHVTDTDFDSTIQKYPLVIVDFWADWCYPCKIIAPMIEALAREYAGKLVCVKLNVDKNPRTAMKFRIVSIPTLILFKDGIPIDTIVGAAPKSHFDAKIKPYL